MSKVLGRVIRHLSLGPADLRAGLLAEGMPEAVRDTAATGVWNADAAVAVS